MKNDWPHFLMVLAGLLTCVAIIAIMARCSVDMARTCPAGHRYDVAAGCIPRAK